MDDLNNYKPINLETRTWTFIKQVKLSQHLKVFFTDFREIGRERERNIM